MTPTECPICDRELGIDDINHIHVCIDRKIAAALEKEQAKWMSATEHPSTCGYVNGPKPPCTCGAHARLAELHSEAARAIRARQGGQ